LVVLVASVVALLGTVVVRPERVLRWTARRLHKWPSLRNLAVRTADVSSTAVSIFRSPRDAAGLVFSTALALFFTYIRFYLLLIALGVALPVGSFLFGVSLANLASFLPISVFGIGVRDGILVLVFQDAGQTAEAAVAFSILILLVNHILNLVWGFVAWVLETR
jgi:uncharacterized membrane protein YbhN (UPF0104 family)